MSSAFAPLCPDNPLALSQDQQKKLAAWDMQSECKSCEVNFQWGFFFDGTNNNLVRDTPHLSQSNIARLYDVYENDRNKPEVQRQYAAGVGTPFSKEIGDQGLGIQQKAGLGAGWGGEARICWALLKFLDNLYTYLEKETIGEALGELEPHTVRRMAADINIGDIQLKEIVEKETEVQLLRQVGFKDTVNSLKVTDNAQPNFSGRIKVLQERRALLEKKLQQWQRNHPKPTLGRIHLSVFGFSRGAAQARVFCNWLKDACDLSNGPLLTLCGIPVQLEFLGIFDTVASVGLANSTVIFDGHGNYASMENLRIPQGVRCLHLVAGHEVRASFPLDKAYGGEAEEVVYPGVHSDVGGGYLPSEQGKGFTQGNKPSALDDTGKLSQIPLCHMYREAVAAGVPLNAARANLSQEAKDAFKVDEGLRRAFNGYVQATNAIQATGTDELMHAHYGLYLRWRRLRLGEQPPNGMVHQPFVTRAAAFKRQDVTDLVDGNRELLKEWKFLESLNAPNALSRWVAKALEMIPITESIGLMLKEQIWKGRLHQWNEVRPHWENMAALDLRIVKLHDDYSHDSRSWFKPFGAASEAVWESEDLERLQKLDAQQKKYEKWEKENKSKLDQVYAEIKKSGGQAAYGAIGITQNMPPPVRGNELEDLMEWRTNGHQSRTEKGGREIYYLYGFLQWRRVYALTTEQLAALDAKPAPSVPPSGQWLPRF